MTQIKWDEPDIGDEEIEAVVASMRSGGVGSNGPMVSQFEQEFAERVGAKYAIAVNNGTSALLTALMAFRSKMGRMTVGVPTFTFIASANTALEVGSAIRLIDCNRRTWNIENELVPSDINILMSVDVGGLACDYEALKRIGVPIIADSAESVGAIYKGKRIGSQADVHCFSLHRAKIITTGEGGVVTTNHKELHELMRALVNHGYDPSRKKWEYKHMTRALNFRMTEVQASIGVVQLNKLDRYVHERRQRARIYKDIIGDLAEYQEEPADCTHPYFFFGILIEKEQNSFCEQMWKAGIEVKTWTSVHRQKPYAHLGKECSNADWVSSKVVLLPIHNRLSEQDTIFVAETAKRLLK